MMPPIFSAVAPITPEDAKPLFTPDDSMPRDVLILIGTAILIALAAGIWAVFFRKRKTSSGHEYSGDAALVMKNSSHRRREHRPRNPTRAEIGGLPPARNENPANHPENFPG